MTVPKRICSSLTHARPVTWTSSYSRAATTATTTTAHPRLFRQFLLSLNLRLSLPVSRRKGLVPRAAIFWLLNVHRDLGLGKFHLIDRFAELVLELGV